jgi:hypothetical protein
MSEPQPQPQPSAQPDLSDPKQVLDAVSHASLRLLAGTVSKGTMQQLRRTLEQSPSEFPWQASTQAILAEPVDEQRLVQQGLAAQRDGVLRGGRTAPGPGVVRRTKGFVARVMAQLVFGLCYSLVIIAALLLLKYKLPDFDIYRVLTWIQDLFAKPA